MISFNFGSKTCIIYFWFRSIHWANLASTWPTPVNTSFILYVSIEYPVPTNACYVLNFSDPSAAAGDAICHMWGDATECAFLFQGWSCDVEQINLVSTSTGMIIRNTIIQYALQWSVLLIYYRYIKRKSHISRCRLIFSLYLWSESGVVDFKCIQYCNHSGCLRISISKLEGIISHCTD